MSWRRDNVVLVGLDLETGGLNPRRNPILSIGAFWGTPCQGAKTLRLLVEREEQTVVSPQAAAIVGWENDAQWIEAGAIPLADAFDALADWLTGLRKHLSAAALEPVAHNAEFDRGFLDRWLSKKSRMDVLYHEEGDVRLRKRWHCSMMTLRAMQWAGFFPASRGANLNELRRLMGKPVAGERHDALTDARDCFTGYDWLHGQMAAGLPGPTAAAANFEQEGAEGAEGAERRAA